MRARVREVGWFARLVVIPSTKSERRSLPPLRSIDFGSSGAV